MAPLICRNCSHGQHMRRCCEDVECTEIVCLHCSTRFDWLTGTWTDFAVGVEYQPPHILIGARR